jgi:hypothetical protein
VRVLSARIDFEVTELSASKRTTREHALNREADNLFWVTVMKLSSGCALESADKTSVSVVDLIIPLLTGELDLICVNYDDIVTIINVRSESGLVLATKDVSDL